MTGLSSPASDALRRSATPLRELRKSDFQRPFAGFDTRQPEEAYPAEGVSIFLVREGQPPMRIMHRAAEESLRGFTPTRTDKHASTKGQAHPAEAPRMSSCHKEFNTQAAICDHNTGEDAISTELLMFLLKLPLRPAHTIHKNFCTSARAVDHDLARGQ
jgi:hypothetical protein